jgi:signal peptidase II
MSFQPKNVYWLWLSALIILTDQVTKPHLNITHLQNKGAAFSMLSSLPPWSFALLGVAVSTWIVVWLRQNPHGQLRVAAALSLILGGALGNVIDRVRLGHVTDFIDFYVGHWHFAAFNVADAAISVGAGLLILDMVIDWQRQRKSALRAGQGS